MRRMAVSFLILLGSISMTSNAEVGVTDKEVLIGSHTALSGTFGFYGVISRVAKAYFDQVNAKGGVHGRMIKFIPEDSAWTKPKALEIVRKQAEKDQVFAFFMNTGDAHLAAMKYLEQKKIPDLFIADSSMAYTKPVAKNRFDSMPSFYTEGVTQGQWIAKNMPGKKVCFLTIDGATVGKEGIAGAKEAMKTSVKYGPTEKVGYETVNANSQVLNMQKANCEVVMAFAFPPLVPNAVKYATQIGFKPQWFIQLYGANTSFTKIAGDVGEGVMSNQWMYYEHQTEVPGIKAHHELVKKALPGVPVDNLTIYGQYLAESMVEALNRAGKDLTREGIIKATESMTDWKCSVCKIPMRLGPADHATYNDSILLTRLTKGNWEFVDDSAAKLGSNTH